MLSDLSPVEFTINEFGKVFNQCNACMNVCSDTILNYLASYEYGKPLMDAYLLICEAMQTTCEALWNSYDFVHGYDTESTAERGAQLLMSINTYIVGWHKRIAGIEGNLALVGAVQEFRQLRPH
jgi:hypothetical protein